MDATLSVPLPAQTKRVNPFQLSLWVGLCIVVGLYYERAESIGDLIAHAAELLQPALRRRRGCSRQHLTCSLTLRNQ